MPANATPSTTMKTTTSIRDMPRARLLHIARLRRDADRVAADAEGSRTARHAETAERNGGGCGIDRHSARRCERVRAAIGNQRQALPGDAVIGKDHDIRDFDLVRFRDEVNGAAL